MDKASAKKDENSIAGCIKEVVAEEGKNAFKFIGS
jgi:stage V sporulation protein SpoVS